MPSLLDLSSTGKRCIVSSNDTISTTHRLHRGHDSRGRRCRCVVLQGSLLGTAPCEHRHRFGVRRLLLEVLELKAGDCITRFTPPSKAPAYAGAFFMCKTGLNVLYLTGLTVHSLYDKNLLGFVSAEDKAPIEERLMGPLIVYFVLALCIVGCACIPKK